MTKTQTARAEFLGRLELATQAIKDAHKAAIDCTEDHEALEIPLVMARGHIDAAMDLASDVAATDQNKLPKE